MKKTLIPALILALLLSLAAPAFAFSAVRSAQKLSVDGREVNCDKYNIDGSNYFKLRDLAMLLNGTGSQFDVGWDAEKGVVSVTTNHPYTAPNGQELLVGDDLSATAAPSAQTILIDGEEREDLTVYNIGGSNYFKLRDLGGALGFDVDYIERTNTAVAASRSAQGNSVRVTDLCAHAGRYVSGGGAEYYSFVLPKVIGPDTAYIRSVNAGIQKIYDEHVLPSLDAMEERLSLLNYCVSYKYAVNGGIHSLLITCDSDWDEEYFWCFNFDSDGNPVENAAVLARAGMTEDGFVSAARAYLAKRADYSEYFLDDGWKDYQTRTISDENCNAALPMVLMPGGTLCFIATIYTPAGAERYDRALEFAGGEIRDADVGRTIRSKLDGCAYLVDSEGLGSEGFSYLLDFFTIGDVLTAEVTAFDMESGSVYYYFATDVIPERAADLFRADASSVNVGLLSYCPDVLAGTEYYGEAGRYTLKCDGKTLTLTGFSGGTPLLGDGGDISAHLVYRGDIGLESEVPDTEDFDFDAAEAAGIAGVWQGTYIDGERNTHYLDLELSAWGGLRVRDCTADAIPTVLMGSYRVAAEGDEDAPAGSVVFRLVSRAGYKMPDYGWCSMTVGADGLLRLAEDADSYGALTRLSKSDACFLSRVPARSSAD